MNTHSDMWMEFAKSFGMLFAVLAFFLLALYLVRKFSGRFGARGSVELIKVLSVHHLSPKEKLVLVSVQNEAVFIGVSPAGISSLARFDKIPETGSQTVLEPAETAKGFQNLLQKSLIKGGSGHKMPLESDSSDSGKGKES
ncbi:flagellar biosynthetic protein FliO [Desulfobacter vibrioformis]|uniref:flagellar biosynthetic protein FliO n=1 Tax=Desulfobacter vibrioformis TaxID=34031 RepID=UPI000551236F|nr:flagellar biosynthetic protein FliO [Desulfobacter vibrioformis]